MAKHIQSLNLDQDLNDHLPNAVDRIARVNIGGKQRNFFSFASKYCSWHDPEHYPISDSFVENVLRGYRDLYEFDKFRNSDLRNYARFKMIVENFRNYFGLTKFGLKKLDKFL